jgi:hypothetical protein
MTWLLLQVYLMQNFDIGCNEVYEWGEGMHAWLFYIKILIANWTGPVAHQFY